MSISQKKIFVIHSWSGIIAGIFLLILSLTGSVLCFKEELEPSVHPELHTRQSTSKSLNELYAQVFLDYPEYYPVRIYLPSSPGLPYTGYLLRKNNVNDKLNIYYENGHWKSIPDSWLHFAEDLHIYFKLNYYPGMFLNFLLSLSLTALAVTGFVVYRKKIIKLITFKDAIRLKSIGNWHAVSGLFILLFHTIMAATSCIITFSAVVNGPMKESIFQTSIPKNFNLNKLLPIADQHKIDPQYRLQGITFLKGKTMFHFQSPHVKNGALSEFTRVFLNPLTGETLNTSGKNDKPVLKALNSSVSFHFGNYGGIPVKILYTLGGIFISFMTVSGALIYFRRTKKVKWNTEVKSEKIRKPRKPIKSYLLLGARYWLMALGLFLLTGAICGWIMGDVTKGAYYLSVILLFPAVLNVILLFLTLPFYFLYKLIRWKKIPYVIHIYCAVSASFFALSILWMLLGSF